MRLQAFLRVSPLRFPLGKPVFLKLEQIIYGAQGAIFEKPFCG